jgi:hypothetical protein
MVWSRDDDRAMRGFQMISGSEAKVRKVVGGGIEVLVLVLLALGYYESIPVGVQCLLHAAGLVVFRMGVESQ